MSAIQHAIAALHRANKTPSVALTKAKLTGKVNMPELIQALSHYKNDPEGFVANIPEVPTKANNQSTDVETSLDAKLDSILTEQARQAEQLKRIERLLSALLKEQD